MNGKKKEREKRKEQKKKAHFTNVNLQKKSLNGFL